MLCCVVLYCDVLCCLALSCGCLILSCECLVLSCDCFALRIYLVRSRFGPCLAIEGSFDSVAARLDELCRLGSASARQLVTSSTFS
jgi:hypothetical protein